MSAWINLAWWIFWRCTFFCNNKNNNKNFDLTCTQGDGKNEPYDFSLLICYFCHSWDRFRNAWSILYTKFSLPSGLPRGFFGFPLKISADFLNRNFVAVIPTWDNIRFGQLFHTVNVTSLFKSHGFGANCTEIRLVQVLVSYLVRRGSFTHTNVFLEKLDLIT